ncbi:MAG: heavy metal translocating P-type ATPase [Candidatus Eisenbacteria bacterium]|nr:heavy metal translocating P-type ATPase [Candidatus Eisenbacteria bacterium]
MSVADTPRAVSAEGVLCTHCGLPVPAALVAPEPPQFCCSGCQMAYQVLHDAGLERYYDMSERRNLAVAATGRAYDEFDHEAFQQLWVRTRVDGLRETDLYLEGVHCASCVWLVERTPIAVPGVASAELDLSRGIVRLAWDPETATLASAARFLDTLGYRPHPFRGARADALRRKEDREALVMIGVAGAISMNVMLAAVAIYSGWGPGGMEGAFMRYFRWISMVLSVPTMIWPARPFFVGALSSLRTRTFHMDVPIAIALGGAFAHGVVNTFADSGPIYFDGVVTLVFLLLCGRFLQTRAQRAAVDSSELMHSLSPSIARVVENGEVREVPAEALVPGMILEVRHGDALAGDGVVDEGHSEIDKALLTGESVPQAVGPGDPVFAGTINRGATLRVRVERAGEESRVGQILREVERSASRRAPVVRTADKLAGRFVAAVLVLAAITLWRWYAIDPTRAMDNAIALMIATCPCALALATPLAITVAIGRAARRGILVKGGDALESLARPGVMVLDKTGTLTQGRSTLAEWQGPDDARARVLGLERHSSHPLAAGFAAAWPDMTPAESADVRSTIGGGLEGRAGGRDLVIGSPAFVLSRAADPEGLAAAGADRTLTPVLVAEDGVVVGRAAFGDALRSDAAESLAALRARGWKLRLLSGDAPAVVESVGERLGFAPADCRGGASPEDKLAEIEALSGSGTVVMVGDGVNDAAAIARADVGVGVKGGAEACLAAADVFLARSGLAPLVELTTGAARSLGIIRLGITISILYNVLGVALAYLGYINPLVAAIMMPTSSVTVVWIAWRGRTFDEATR